MTHFIYLFFSSRTAETTQRAFPDSSSGTNFRYFFFLSVSVSPRRAFIIRTLRTRTTAIRISSSSSEIDENDDGDRDTATLHSYGRKRWRPPVSPAIAGRLKKKKGANSEECVRRSTTILRHRLIESNRGPPHKDASVIQLRLVTFIFPYNDFDRHNPSPHTHELASGRAGRLRVILLYATRLNCISYFIHFIPPVDRRVFFFSTLFHFDINRLWFAGDAAGKFSHETRKLI